MCAAVASRGQLCSLGAADWLCQGAGTLQLEPLRAANSLACRCKAAKRVQGWLALLADTSQPAEQRYAAMCGLVSSPDAARLAGELHGECALMGGRAAGHLPVVNLPAL